MGLCVGGVGEFELDSSVSCVNGSCFHEQFHNHWEYLNVMFNSPVDSSAEAFTSSLNASVSATLTDLRSESGPAGISQHSPSESACTLTISAYKDCRTLA